MTVMSNEPWGDYSPVGQMGLLRFLVRIGGGRGAVRGWILRNWQDRFGSIVDVNIRGVRYRLNISDNVTDAKILASSVTYDRKELNFLAAACNGGAFVDVGANIGYYSLAVAKKTGSNVLAIEPNPPTLKRLQFNVEVNPNLSGNITIVSEGVGPVGEFELYGNGNLGAASLCQEVFDSSAKTVKVTTRPLLDIIREHKIHRIDSLKIDIEGMEDRALVPFLREAQRSMLPVHMVLENAHQHLWRHDLLRELRDKGYREVLNTRGNTFLQRK